MARKFSVLCYSGAGVSPASLAHTLKSLRALLSPYYTVNTIATETLLADPWHSQCALLVFPGGRDIPFHAALQGKGNELIQKFVREGGSFLGICAGGYYGASEIRFMMDDSVYKVHEVRELGFWEGTCEGTVFPGFQYSSEKGTRLAEMAVDVDAIRQVVEQDGRKLSPDLKPSVPVYYNGGGAFVPPADPSSSSSSSSAPIVLARYAEAPGAPNATVFMRVGAGRALLCGTHPEFSFHEDPLLSALTREPGGGPSVEDSVELEKDRIELIKALLLTLDIGLPDSEDKDKLERPTHPLPQFLVAHPNKLDLTQEFVNNISTHFAANSASDGPSVLPDANDTFHFHQSPSLPSISSYMSEARSKTLSIEEADHLDQLVKHVVVADRDHGSADAIHHERWTPLFDWPTYWAELDAARKLVRDEGGYDTKEGEARVGDLVLYSEAVTSTQTMLDKNPKLLHSLPTPLVSHASYQLSGRGRSGNIWLSPTGCLQFTIALTLPPTMGPKVVFIQYLAALAIAHALDPAPPSSKGEGPLGVRIKWPNDVYALVKGETGRVEKVKMGGILVNSNYAGGQFRIMVGCGVNILNKLPTTSLASLTEIHNKSSPEAEPKLPMPTMEGSLARILAKFGSMWEEFLAAPGGGFEPFLNDYLDRWLHSDQLVHLLTTNPPTPVRITTITLDHGLLRTTPVRTNRDAYGGEYDGFRTRMGAMGLNDKKTEQQEQYIDLQPDGNSFDIMAGMIRAKR